jgi:hypothetical protein
LQPRIASLEADDGAMQGPAPAPHPAAAAQLPRPPHLAPALAPLLVPCRRYNGYNAAEYARVVDRYEQLEAVRRDIKVGLGGRRARGLGRGPRAGRRARGAWTWGRLPLACLRPPQRLGGFRGCWP